MRKTLTLPDSKIFSEMALPQPNPKVLANYYQNLHHIGVAITVWHELLYGIKNMPMGKRRENVNSFIRNEIGLFPKYYYSLECTEIHAQIRADARKKGKTLAFADS